MENAHQQIAKIMDFFESFRRSCFFLCLDSQWLFYADALGIFAKDAIRRAQKAKYEKNTLYPLDLY